MGPNPQFSADLRTFTEEILNGNFVFCAVIAVEGVSFPVKINPITASVVLI